MPVASKSSFPGPSSHSPTLKHKFEGHDGVISSFAFLHDNVHIISGSDDETMRKWDYETGLLVGELRKWRGGRIHALALSPDGKTIAYVRGDGRLQMRDMDGEMIEDNWTSKHINVVRSLSWSPSGSHLASGSENGTILIQNAESRAVEVGPITTWQHSVCSLTYSPSGDRIASGGIDDTICIWDSNTGKRLVGPIQGLGSWKLSIAWSLDSSKLYSTSNNFARVFESTSGRELYRLGHDDWLYSLALSPKHNLLACVGGLGVAQLWDTESHQPIGRPFHQEDGKHLYCVSFSQDGKYLAYGGEDKKITLWMVKDIAPEIEEAQPEPPSSSSCLEVDATKSIAQTQSDGFTEDNAYNDFFRSLKRGSMWRST